MMTARRIAAAKYDLELIKKDVPVSGCMKFYRSTSHLNVSWSHWIQE